MKVLHLSFHRGCQNDIEYICNELIKEQNIELSFMEFDDGITTSCAKYNIGHDRANNCWNKYKEYFYTFDIIITSDTAPISRVFLQNNFEKKLIIWICNRFDYRDAASLDCDFPDKEYYDLIRAATHKNNVKIIGYTPFENYYAKHIRNIDVGDFIIKPIGKLSSVYTNNYIETPIVNKYNKFFVPPYHNDTIMINLSQKLNELNIPNHNGRYNGPLDLVNYKGIIHIPYAWSNLAFFEAIQLGIIYFIPSKNFLFDLIENKNFFWSPPFVPGKIELSEWYNPEHADILIYFDSWTDLVYKTNNTNYEETRNNILLFADRHTIINLNKWKTIIS
jgi:hypothetical protein